MSTENLETPAIVEPVVEPVAPPAPPVEVEKRYEYQPTDEQGRPIGGKQVIVYKTEQELAEKLRDQNVKLIQKLREVTRKQRLGIEDKEAIPDDAERFESIVEFKPRQLSVAEKFQIAQDLSDPEKFEAARDRLLESAVGATADDLRKTLNQQQIVTMQLMARNNYDIFRRSNNNFYDCMDNAEVLTNWMLKKGLAPTVKNFGYAFSTLKEAGLLLEAPIVREEAPKPTAQPAAPAPVNTEANPQPPAAPESRITPVEQPQAKRQASVPSGLNSRVASASGVPVTETGKLTWAIIDRMPSEEYRRKLSDPKFRAQIAELEAETAARKNGQ
jgi:hypothetical protein